MSRLWQSGDGAILALLLGILGMIAAAAAVVGWLLGERVYG
jgi:hypothetical protein